MALVVFLRGVNVGGHRTFRPAQVAKQLRAFDVVNIGAAGTFVVRKPGTRAKFLAALRKKLPFECIVAFCDGRELLRIETENPFAATQAPAGTVRFVGVLVKPGEKQATLPITLPVSGPWLVRLVASDKRFVFGEYRRHMKTIGYLDQAGRRFGAATTVRNWNTIGAILRVLHAS